MCERQRGFDLAISRPLRPVRQSTVLAPRRIVVRWTCRTCGASLTDRHVLTLADCSGEDGVAKKHGFSVLDFRLDQWILLYVDVLYFRLDQWILFYVDVSFFRYVDGA